MGDLRGINKETEKKNLNKLAFQYFLIQLYKSTHSMRVTDSVIAPNDGF